MTDWKALDRRIAREVMQWYAWNELPREARQAYWALMDEEPADWTLAYNRGKWWFLDESGRADWEDSIEEWQPHRNVAQALMAADKICEQDWSRELTRLGPSPKRYASFGHYRVVGRDTFDGYAETDAKAICSALQAWLDAQKETQNDPG